MINYAIIDSRLDYKCKNALVNMNLSLIEIPVNIKYDTPVSAHPDLYILMIDNKIFADAEVYNIMRKHLFDSKYEIIKVENIVKSDKIIYPNDCTLNFAICGRNIIGNDKYINPAVREHANNNGYKFIRTNQGYAKCNICVIGDNAIITEDKGIYNECKNNGIDVLLLNEKSIKLSGYDYGFIGGASGLYKDKDKSKVLFCGDITLHSEYNKIFQFCSYHNVEIISLSDDGVYDYGSIFIV